MRWSRLLLALLIAVLIAASSALSVAPKAKAKARPSPPSRDTLATIAKRTDKLSNAVAQLRKQGVRDPVLADVEIYLKAARWAVDLGELPDQAAADRTLAVLDRGLLRASQARRGEAPWSQQTGHSVAHGFRSDVDGSLQPYAVTVPADYGTIRGKLYRLDVVLHGRNDTLNEVAFLDAHRGAKSAPKDLSHVRLDVYGRGNNAYRWAGETDVYEAVKNFLTVEGVLNRSNLLDQARVVLRGFSMGGAGTWHIGLHGPYNWCVIGPGAGFTRTHGYVKGLPDKLPDYQEACLRIYDAVDYAENAANVPVVAYAGSKDAQIQAGRTIEAKLKPLGIPMTFLVAPGVGHTMPPAWEKKAEEEYAKHAAKGRPEYPRKIRFVTWTLRYPSCNWVEVLSLERHYQRALVEAERTEEDGFAVKTKNVRALHLHLWPSATREPIEVKIDGQKLERVIPSVARSNDLHVYLEKRGGRWSAILPERWIVDRLRVLLKTSGLQGPIDDAFVGTFLCVRGTGEAWHEETAEYARENLARFKKEWAKYLRGELPIKNDVDVTTNDIASRHLILFGDPASNSLIGQVVPRLPLKWTKKTITWGGKEYDAGKHVPVLIYPSPLAMDRYVVLNSGHTFHAADFQGTNALLYPRLGDFALLKLAPTKKDPLAVKVRDAGLFDDFWRRPARP
jgi:dienelactone hydrolase